MMKNESSAIPICENTRRFSRPGRIILATGVALSGAVGVACLWVWHVNQPNPDYFFCTAQEAARSRLGPNGAIAQALELYKFDNGRYPDQIRNLVMEPQPQNGPTKWKGPYLQHPDNIKDPWGHEFRYVRTQTAGPSGPVEEFSVWSIGPDGLDQTADDIRGP